MACEQAKQILSAANIVTLVHTLRKHTDKHDERMCAANLLQNEWATECDQCVADYNRPQDEKLLRYLKRSNYPLLIVNGPNVKANFDVACTAWSFWTYLPGHVGHFHHPCPRMPVQPAAALG